MALRGAARAACLVMVAMRTCCSWHPSLLCREEKFAAVFGEGPLSRAEKLAMLREYGEECPGAWLGC